MTVVCIDLEGVLIPEIWHEVAKRTGIEELKLTTRDIADYDELMRMRLEVLRRRSVKIGDIGEIIVGMGCLRDARQFLRALRGKREVIIVSDTFYQFSNHFMGQLGWPTLFCNDLIIDADGTILDYRLRQDNGKKHVVRKLRALGFGTYATGDSYNDLEMIMDADRGSFFCPPQSIVAEHPDITVCRTHDELLRDILGEGAATLSK